MSSQEFYDQFRAGELGDSLDYVSWAGLCDVALSHGVLSATPARA